VSARVAADRADEVVFLERKKIRDPSQLRGDRAKLVLAFRSCDSCFVPFNRHSSRAAGYAVVHRRGAMRNEFDILFEVRGYRNRTFLLPGSLLPTTVSLTTSANAPSQPRCLLSAQKVHARCYEAPSRGA
jgi:hypothetical protein